MNKFTKISLITAVAISTSFASTTSDKIESLESQLESLQKEIKDLKKKQKKSDKKIKKS
jgi:chaperonin cofactor prefoldin